MGGIRFLIDTLSLRRVAAQPQKDLKNDIIYLTTQDSFLPLS